MSSQWPWPKDDLGLAQGSVSALSTRAKSKGLSFGAHRGNRLTLSRCQPVTDGADTGRIQLVVATPIVALLIECFGWSLVAEDLSETAVEYVDDSPSLPET